MYNFKITWQGSITDTKFTEEIEADTLVEAVNEFYGSYKHEVEIVKIKRCKIKSVASADYNLGVIVGAMSIILAEIIARIIFGMSGGFLK